MSTTWEAMEPRERDAFVAVRLFGWRWLLQDGWGGTPKQHVALFPGEAPGREIYMLHDNAVDVTGSESKYQRFSDWDRMMYREDGDTVHRSPRILPHYTTDAADDYRVLEKVRETWDREAKIRYEDALGNLLHERFPVSPEPDLLQYKPGDYSHAAYLALTDGLDTAPSSATIKPSHAP